MDKRIHPAVEMYAREYEAGKLSRREFISRATMLGLASTTAYGLIGAAAPTPARAQPVTGGTIRISMKTKALKDPRLWDWTELVEFLPRLAGLPHRVQPRRQRHRFAL
jgi:peptide/nickel transport system substrate-binding protein